MTLSIFRQIAFAGLRTSLISASVLGSVMIASAQDPAVSARPVPPERSQIDTAGFRVSEPAVAPHSAITLDPPTGWDFQVHSFDAHGIPLPEMPANYRRLGDAKAGEPSDLHTLTLRFSETLTLNNIKSTPDFRMEPGGSCVEGALYEANATCTLLVSFTPQGPGHRLGFLRIANSAMATPAYVGLTGSGYAPVISFTPSQITTLPSTVSSGNGIISGSTNMTVDGGDILYIADIGNSKIREIDSSGALNTINPAFATPASLAVDSAGIIYSANVAASTYYFSDFTPWGVQTAFGYAYVPSSCTPSAPCAFSAVGMSSPAGMSIDAYDNLFFLEGTTGAAEMPVASLGQGTGTLSLWHLKDQYAYASGGPGSFAVDANGNLYTDYINGPNGTCVIYEESLYDAEYSPKATRVAGSVKCGFSGDGGQGRAAEISTTIGEFAFDAAGNFYFNDTGNQRVRRIDAVTGIIRTIAGNGTAGQTGDNGRATSAELNNPTGLAVDSQSNVYILSSATSGQVVRKVGSPGLLVFNNQNRTTSSAAQPITVSNTGNSAMILTNAVITGPNAGDFKIDNNSTTCILTSGSTLYSGQTCKIGVIFTPSAVGSRSATLTLLDNTVNGADSVNWSGNGQLGTPTLKVTAPANNASFTSGSNITFTASVTSASGPQPTGTVQFKVDGTNHGSPVALSSGTASTTVSGLSVASHTLSFTYSGDSNYATAGPVSVNITVTAAAAVKFTSPSSTKALASTADVTLAVTVTSAKGPAPTGKVQFSVDGKTVGTAAVVSEKASVKAGTLAAGTHKATAAYSGDRYHPPAKTTETFTVQ